MSLNIFWFLPTHGDGKYLGTAEGARAVDHGYLTQIAQAADRLGFGGVLIEECSGYAIGWHEVQAGLRIDGFWDGAVQVNDMVMATITPDHVRPTVITTARVIATHRGLVWVETDDEQLLVLPASKVERAEGILDAV